MTRATMTSAIVIGLCLAFGASALAAGAHMTKAQAQREIIGDGYTGVSALHQTKAGWEAKALEAGKPVTILVTSHDVEKTQ